MKSIIRGDNKHICYNCGRFFEHTHKHHIFGGANRKHSEKYGLTVHLCPGCHNMSDRGIHFNKNMMDEYHRLGQIAFESQFDDINTARALFISIFGRNYLDPDDGKERESEKTGFLFLGIDEDDLPVKGNE